MKYMQVMLHGKGKNKYGNTRYLLVDMLKVGKNAMLEEVRQISLNLITRGNIKKLPDFTKKRHKRKVIFVR